MAKGGNNYQLPHMEKLRLENAGALPTCVNILNEVIQDGYNLLDVYTQHFENGDATIDPFHESQRQGFH